MRTVFGQPQGEEAGLRLGAGPKVRRQWISGQEERRGRQLVGEEVRDLEMPVAGDVGEPRAGLGLWWAS